MGLTTRILYTLGRAGGPVPTPDLVAACCWSESATDTVSLAVWHTLIRLERKSRVERVGEIRTDNNRLAVAWSLVGTHREQVRRLGGTMPDPKLAKLIGCCRDVVRHWRQVLGIPPCPQEHKPVREPTTAEIEALIAEQLQRLPKWWVSEQARHRAAEAARGPRVGWQGLTVRMDKRRRGVM